MTEVTRDELAQMVAAGDVTVWTKGENVTGYTNDPPEIDPDGFICEVCGRAFVEHTVDLARAGVGRIAHFPDEPQWSGLRCPPEDAPAA